MQALTLIFGFVGFVSVLYILLTVAVAIIDATAQTLTQPKPATRTPRTTRNR